MRKYCKPSLCSTHASRRRIVHIVDKVVQFSTSIVKPDSELHATGIFLSLVLDLPLNYIYLDHINSVIARSGAKCFWTRGVLDPLGDVLPDGGVTLRVLNAQEHETEAEVV